MSKKKKPAEQQQSLGLAKVADILPRIPQLKQHLPVVKPDGPVGLRLIEAASYTDQQTILYQHTVFCQTGLPYRDPGDDVRSIERTNGNVGLEVTAGKAWHPAKGRFIELGLPFGTKPRLILADINTQAILTQKPQIDLENTITKFVKRMNLHTHGRNIRAIKDAMSRLCAASIRLGLTHQDGHGSTFNSQIVTGFDIWFPKDDRQRVLWPSKALLSGEYFNSLMIHGVPLDESHYLALSHSAMAMDIYAWLAQRLHRIKAAEVLISWQQLHLQFGWNYQHVREFRRVFKVALKEVLAVYHVAKVEADERGLILRNSPPPVLKTQILLS